MTRSNSKKSIWAVMRTSGNLILDFVVWLQRLDRKIRLRIAHLKCKSYSPATRRKARTLGRKSFGKLNCGKWNSHRFKFSVKSFALLDVTWLTFFSNHHVRFGRDQRENISKILKKIFACYLYNAFDIYFFLDKKASPKTIYLGSLGECEMKFHKKRLWKNRSS